MTVANARNTNLPDELADIEISLKDFTGTVNQNEQHYCKSLVNITKYFVCHSMYAYANDE